MSKSSVESQPTAEPNRLLALAALGAGLVDTHSLAAAQADGRAHPGQTLVDALALRNELGAPELARLRDLADALTAPASAARARFHPLRRLASGSLGEVWVAFDIDLERLVALKRLRQDAADTDESRERLRREALLTARIPHPGVVPILATITDAHGRPSHAMRLVTGESLQAELRRLHAIPDANPDPKHRLALLESVIQACAAIEFAHEHGFIHRDLHPANLLREPDGTTFVIGWEHAQAPEGPDPEAGRALGVPGFAAPELAQGRTAVADARADIYSLGAIVFTVWTGHVPDSLPTINRHAGRALPHGLAAICRKALAQQPEDRHAHAADLAEDLRAWRDDRPPRFAEESPAQRLGRSLRQHRLAWALTVLALAVILLVGAAARVASQTARRIHAEAHAQWQDTRNAAERVMNANINTIDRLEALIADDSIRSDPRLAPFRRQIPDIGRSLLEPFQYAFAPWLSASQRLKLGSAILDTAVQSNHDAAYKQGLNAASTAEHIFLSLQNDPEEGPHAVAALAGALRARAYSLQALHRFDESLQASNHALTLLNAVLDESPSNADLLSKKAAILADRAMLQHDQGLPGNPRAAFNEAVALASRAARIEPANPDHRDRIAAYLNHLGDLALEAARPAEARRNFEQALADHRALLNEQPDNPDFQLNLAASLHRLAHLDHVEGRDDAALPLLDQALALLDNAIAAEPDRIAHPFQRALILIERADIERDAKTYQDARNTLDQAMLALSPLLSRIPDHPDLLPASAQILQARAEVALKADDLNDAVSQYQLAVNELRRLLRLAPSQRDARRRLAFSFGRLAAVELRRNSSKTNDLGHAYQHAQEAIDLGQYLLDKQPFHPDLQFTLVQALLTLAETQATGAVRAEAYPTLQRCDDTLRTKAANLSPLDRGRIHARLATDFSQAATALAEAGRHQEAETAATRALDHLDDAAKLGEISAEWLRRNPQLDPLRDNPRFRGLLDDLNMPRDPFPKIHP